MNYQKYITFLPLKIRRPAKTIAVDLGRKATKQTKSSEDRIRKSTQSTKVLLM